MYDFLTGPMMWATLAGVIFGTIYKTVKLMNIASSGFWSGTAFLNPNAGFSRSFKSSFLGQHPSTSLVSVVFHLVLFTVPLFLKGHNLLMDSALGFSLPMISDTVSDKLTLICLACCLYFLMRRLLIRRVRAITSLYDYLILALVIIPFLTGFALYHKLLSYEMVLNLHIISGQLMLVAIPFTRLSHMLVFFVLRFPFTRPALPKAGAFKQEAA